MARSAGVVPEQREAPGWFQSSAKRRGVSRAARSAGVVPGQREAPEWRRGGKMRDRQNYYSLPFNPKLRERAKELRKAGNLSEVLMWKQLYKGKFKGFDFDRQKIIGNYIVDFYCTNCNAVIEIDGSSHDDKVEYDQQRDAFLEGLGLSVIHIPAADVLHRLDAVMRMLQDHPALNHPGPAGHPSKEGNFWR